MSVTRPLHGRTAIVTGSTSGIGLGIARALADCGATVVLNGLGETAAIESLRCELAQASDVGVYFDPADMREPAQIRRMVAEAAERTGCVDIVVNNAGIQHVAPVDEFPAEKWDQIIAINLSSAFHSIAAALPLMRAAGWGRIINMASAHALVASPFKAAYVAAKHGLAGLTRTVALECAEQGITVNAIAPGYVSTPLVTRQIAATAQARGIPEETVVRDVMLAAQPTRRFVTIEEVAALAIFLCSDAAASITGAVLPVDGGWTAA